MRTFDHIPHPPDAKPEVCPSRGSGDDRFRAKAQREPQRKAKEKRRIFAEIPHGTPRNPTLLVRVLLFCAVPFAPLRENRSSLLLREERRHIPALQFLLRLAKPDCFHLLIEGMLPAHAG